MMDSVGTRIEVVQRFYAALLDGDMSALLGTLDPHFRAELTPGLPNGWGRTYSGARDLLDKCWRPMFAQAEIRAVPRRYLPSPPSVVVAVGDYRITHRVTGSRSEASFVHIFEFAGGRIVELVQVTDSARWHQALGTAAARDHGADSR
jgi:uncharacterized protein